MHLILIIDDACENIKYVVDVIGKINAGERNAKVIYESISARQRVSAIRDSFPEAVSANPTGADANALRDLQVVVLTKKGCDVSSPAGVSSVVFMEEPTSTHSYHEAVGGLLNAKEGLTQLTLFLDFSLYFQQQEIQGGGEMSCGGSQAQFWYDLLESLANRHIDCFCFAATSLQAAAFVTELHRRRVQSETDNPRGRAVVDVLLRRLTDDYDWKDLPARVAGFKASASEGLKGEQTSSWFHDTYIPHAYDDEQWQHNSVIFREFLLMACGSQTFVDHLFQAVGDVAREDLHEHLKAFVGAYSRFHFDLAPPAVRDDHAALSDAMRRAAYPVSPIGIVALFLRGCAKAGVAVSFPGDRRRGSWPDWIRQSARRSAVSVPSNSHKAGKAFFDLATTLKATEGVSLDLGFPNGNPAVVLTMPFNTSARKKQFRMSIADVVQNGGARSAGDSSAGDVGNLIADIIEYGRGDGSAPAMAVHSNQTVLTFEFL